MCNTLDMSYTPHFRSTLSDLQDKENNAGIYEFQRGMFA